MIAAIIQQDLPVRNNEFTKACLHPQQYRQRARERQMLGAISRDHIKSEEIRGRTRISHIMGRIANLGRKRDLDQQ